MACKACRHQKRKCTPVEGKDSCEYCITKKIKCEEHTSQQGRRTDLEQQGCSNVPRPTTTTSAVPDSHRSLAKKGEEHGPLLTLRRASTKPIICNDGQSVDKDSTCGLSSDESSSGVSNDEDSDYEDDSVCSSSSESSHEHGSLLQHSTVTQLDATTSVLSTHSTGCRRVYTATNNGRFVTKLMRRRHKMSEQGPFTLITSTSLPYMKNGCNGRYVMYRAISETDNDWKFGIVSSMHYLETVVSDGTAHIFEWNGAMTSAGYPSFLDTSSWEDGASKDFTYTRLSSADTLIEFVNQVSGKTFSNTQINPRARNETDGGIQCVFSGPDKMPIEVPIMEEPQLTQLLLVNRLTNIPGKSNLYKKIGRNGRKRSPNKIAKMHNANNAAKAKSQDEEAELELAKSWQKPPRQVIEETQMKLVIISSVDQDQATTVNTNDKNLFFAPTLASIKDNTTPLVKFAGLNKKSYKELSELELTVDNYDNNIQSRQLSSHYLLDCYDVKLPTTIDENLFHGYTTVYPSNACPSIDFNNNESQTFTLPDESISIKCIFVSANKFECQGYAPLSVGLHDSKFHGISILPSHLRLIEKAVGVGGLFTRRSRSKHNGSLTFVGPRAQNSCSQPSPSEGPNESGYWYFRQSLSHFFWPFVLHLMMFLGSRISLLSYYQYLHLAKLLPPLSNDDPIRWNFCDIGILTKDYNSSPHTDANDTLDYLDNYFKEQLNMLSRSTYLPDHQQQRARNALNHVERWGTGTPTTCGYQVVGDTSLEEVEIIQYFCCRGLGICYRINNYWVHMFLAFCFSHYTSVAIFIKGGKVYFGKYPGISMFAWGKGRRLGSYSTVINGQSVRRSRRLTS